MRAWRLDVDRTRIEGTAGKGLEISFDVTRSLEQASNSAQVRIWGLKAETRQALSGLSVKGKRPGKIKTELHAGTDKALFLLFHGDLRYSHSERDGSDWVTTVEGEDGGRAQADSQINRSFAPGTRVDQVALACANALGLGLGNLPQALKGTSQTFDSGTTVSGKASDNLRGLLKSLDLRYSVQHGVIQVLATDRGLQIPQVLISKNTGLVGSPTRTPEGRVLARVLLQPGLDPGVRARLQSDEFKGTYIVRSNKMAGDASGQEWYSDLELQEPTS